MSEAKRIAKELMRLESQMFSISDTADTLAQATEGLAKSIGTAANESKIWTAASRILSGTGLWKLQNYLRGGIQLLTFYKDAQAKAIESQNESMKSLASLSEEFVTVNQKTKELQGILKNGTGFKEAIKDNLELKLQMDSMAEAVKASQGALKDFSEEDAQKRAVERTLKIYEYQGNQMKKLLDKRNKLVEKEIAKEELLEKLSLERTLKRRLKVLEERIFTGEASKEEIEEFDKKEGQLKEVKKDTGFLKAVNFKDNLFEPFAKLKELYDRKESLKENLARIRDKLTLGAMSKLGKVAGLALKYSILFVLFLLGAFFVFSLIRKIMENAEAMQVVMDVISGIMGSVFLAVESIVDIFSAFFGSGTFMEKGMKLLEGVVKIFAGLGGIIMSVMVGIVALTLKGLFALLKTIFWDASLKPVFDFIKKGYTKFMEFLVSLGNLPFVVATLAFFGVVGQIVASISDFIGNFFTALGETAGAIGEMIYGAIKGEGVPFVPFFANGGVSAGGLAVVGEKGPELVNLPKGARVHSNAESRKMAGGNTIHVHVNGRLGASDSELRDIAKKVGRMVSAEINRSTSSSTNVRY